MLAFLDTNIVIYLVEKPAPLGLPAAERVGQLVEAEGRVVASELVRMEARVGPLLRSDHGLLARFDAFFENPDVHVVEITRAVCDRAADIRARHRFGSLDALHLAAAIEAGRVVFLTNDARLQGFEGLRVEVLG